MASSTRAVTIYIPLLNQGTSVVGPTQAVKLGENLYRVLPTQDSDPSEEEWELPLPVLPPNWDTARVHTNQIPIQETLLTAAQRGLSLLELQPGLCKEGTDQMRLLPQAPDGQVEFLVQLVQVPTHQVAHLDVLQVMPPALIPGVEVGGIARQCLQPDPA